MRSFFTSLISRLLTLIIILFLTFVLLHLVPGGPFASDRALPPEIENNLYQKYGLHKRGADSLVVWIAKDSVSYGQKLLHLKLGPSLKYVDRDVTDIIRHALPTSFILGSASLFCALSMAFIFALAIVYANQTWIENLTAFLSSFVISLPSFVKAVIFISLFSLTLKWLPPALWESPSSAILPVITLALAPFFLILELLISELKKEHGKFYVVTARAKGVDEKTILFKHVLRNSLNPLLSILGPITTSLITGSFIVETIFSIPGLGRHFILAVVDRDYFLVMGITIVFALLLILFNWLTESISHIVDPRTL